MSPPTTLPGTIITERSRVVDDGGPKNPKPRKATTEWADASQGRLLEGQTFSSICGNFAYN